MALSCGMIAMIDDAIGRVLSALAASGTANDTVVIFTTDHGDYLGDHRLLLKGPAHYEGITHVPFIWAEPGTRAPRRSAVMGGTLDIAATILDRARVQPYNGIQGLSLLPAIGGETLARDSMVIEDDQQRAIMGFAAPPRLRSLITERYRPTIRRIARCAVNCSNGSPIGKWNLPTARRCRAGGRNRRCGRDHRCVVIIRVSG
jgi:hypothetical protein